MASKRKAGSRKPAKAGGASPQARVLEAMQQVWLAGLGAVSKAQRGAPKLLEELIEEGERVQRTTRGTAEKAVKGLLGDVQSTIDERVGDIRTRTADALDNLEKIFQTRVHRALSQLGVPSAEEVTALSKRVDALNHSIEKLARKSGRAHTEQAVKKVVQVTPVV
jgi:poly(hydroxyalkanoate) granule-associated protein